MIQSKNALVVAAFSALGLAGWAGQDPTDTGGAAPSPAAAAPTPAAGAQLSGPVEQYVLLTDGRFVKGVVRVDEEEDKVLVTSPLGIMPFPSKKVERIFANIKEVHAFKRDQVPDEDLGEQMKLTHWCLSNGLTAEAREHLNLILQLDKKHPQATAMLGSMKMEETRVARRQQMDAQVQQAGAEVVDPTGPATLDPAVLRGASRNMGVNNLPMIFDLPPSAAIKRAQEYNSYVHPVLQVHCARCHDDRYKGDFQLVHIQRKQDQTPEALRANLDATLKLVDRDVPGRSKLLSSSLLPHGSGQNTRPIFQGSNDKAYRILEAWVNNLRSHPAPHPLAGEPPRAAQDGEEEFAVSRSRIRSTVEVEPITGTGASAPPPARRHIETPDMRFTPGQGWVEDENPGETAPIPFSVSGTMPKAPAAGAKAPPAAAPKIPRPRTAAPAVMDADAIAKAQAEAEAIAAQGAPPLPTDDDADEDEVPVPRAKRSSKPVQIDPSLLQKALEKKNGVE